MFMNSSPCTIMCHQYRAQSRYQKKELNYGSVTETERSLASENTRPCTRHKKTRISSY